MTNAPPTITKLPAFLEMTDHQIAESNRIQAEVRQALHGRVQASREEARLIRGIHAERAARATLAVLSVEKKRPHRSQAINLHLAKLADAFADQGRYEEAASTHPVRARAKQYLAIQAAIDRPDSDICSCPPREVKDPLSGKMLRIPTHNKVEDVYSQKHRRMVPLVRCSSCPHMNAGVLPEMLRQREQAMLASKPKPDHEHLK